MHVFDLTEVAQAVTVLINDCDMTSDEALEYLTEVGIISDEQRALYRVGYWNMVRTLRTLTDTINAERRY